MVLTKRVISPCLYWSQLWESVAYILGTTIYTWHELFNFNFHTNRKASCNIALSFVLDLAEWYTYYSIAYNDRLGTHCIFLYMYLTSHSHYVRWCGTGWMLGSPVLLNSIQMLMSRLLVNPSHRRIRHGISYHSIRSVLLYCLIGHHHHIVLPHCCHALHVSIHCLFHMIDNMTRLMQLTLMTNSYLLLDSASSWAK